ncbi:MAG: DNA methyltransferase [Candidatus Anstonellaceae archaeon]
MKETKFIQMTEITQKDYQEFIRKTKKIIIEDTVIEIGKVHNIKVLQPEKFELETTTVWSFPKRGEWATHYLNAKYRGNWAPQVVRNILLRYSKEGDVVLDAFVGSGTTLIECKLTNRKGIGVDINKEALILTRDRLNFNSLSSFIEQKTFLGDARNLDLISDESVDLILTHPPYASIIPYTKNSNYAQEGDLSKVRSAEEFFREMKKVAQEFFRVLKPGKYCAILIGDTRRNKHQVLISFGVLKSFLESGFILKEDIIKIQHNTKTAHLWKKSSIKNNFLLLAHEHLFVFRKPQKGEKLTKFKESTALNFID